MDKYLVLILALFFLSCQNPVKEDRPQEDNKGIITFSFYSDYGYCDSSGCYGLSVTLLINGEDSGKFNTGKDSIPYQEKMWIKYIDTYFMYQTKREYILELSNGDAYLLNGQETIKLNLNSNTNYNYKIK